jgi:hypothetical protein
LESELDRLLKQAQEPVPAKTGPSLIIVAIIAGVFALLAGAGDNVASDLLEEPDCLAFVEQLVAIDAAASTPQGASEAAGAVQWGSLASCGDTAAIVGKLNN